MRHSVEHLVTLPCDYLMALMVSTTKPSRAVLPGQLGDYMRSVATVFALVFFFLNPLDARGEYNCFESYGGERRCACIGTSDCSQMKTSNSCKSDPKCDTGLG